MGQAITNNRLKDYTDRVETLMKLSSITMDLSQTHDIDEILKKIIQASKEICDAVASSIMLVDKEKDEIFFKVSAGEKSEEVTKYKLPIDETSIAGWVIVNKTPLIVNDVSQDPRHCKHIDEKVGFSTRSLLAVPIMWGDEIFGVVEAINKNVNGFTWKEKEYLTIIASQAAIAIKNAQLIADLKSAKNLLIQQEKLAITGLLSSSLAHEIKNFVFMIDSPILLLSREKNLSDTAKELLGIATEGVGKLLLLTKKINSFCANKNIDKKEYNINEVIESVHLIVEKEASKRKSKIIRNFEKNLPPVEIDRGRIEQVFVNIIINALDAMEPDGGKLTISTLKNNGQLEIKFTDTGEGIAKEKINNLFEPFYTTKEKGTGLGLFSCKQIIENEHNGKLTVESEVGKWTTFTIVLPV